MTMQTTTTTHLWCGPRSRVIFILSFVVCMACVCVSVLCGDVHKIDGKITRVFYVIVIHGGTIHAFVNTSLCTEIRFEYIASCSRPAILFGPFF